MTKILLTEKNSALSFRVRSIKEKVKAEIDKNGLMIVKRTPCTIMNEKNANGRTYTDQVISNAISKAKTNGIFEARRLLCTANDHPPTTYPQPTTSSHIVIDAYIEKVDNKSVLFNDWVVLNTVEGKNLRALIEAGASVGTSIRGLGSQDKESGAISEYEFLGTDGVGNPSAGTFSPFDLTESLIENLNEGVSIESASEELKEAIENLQEQQQENSQGGQEMFVLEESINAFKEKYGTAPEKTSEVIGAVLEIEKQVIETGADLEIFEAFKVEALGAKPETKLEENKDKERKAEDAKDADVVNKVTRQLEANEVITSYLKEQNDELFEELRVLTQYKESANSLVSQLTDKAKEATQKLKENESVIKESEEAIVEQYRVKAIEIVEDLQAEAKVIIQEKEEQLEAAIQLGDLIGDHFKVMRAITESLIERINSKKEKFSAVKKESVKTKESIVESKRPSKRQDGFKRSGPLANWK